MRPCCYNQQGRGKQTQRTAMKESDLTDHKTTKTSLSQTEKKKTQPTDTPNTDNIPLNQGKECLRQATSAEAWRATAHKSGTCRPYTNAAGRNHGKACRPSAESRGGLGCAPDPAGTRASSVEARGSSQHARQTTALHHRQLAIHIGKAGGVLVP
jgi:hypothetical protein